MVAYIFFGILFNVMSYLGSDGVFRLILKATLIPPLGIWLYQVHGQNAPKRAYFSLFFAFCGDMCLEM